MITWVLFSHCQSVDDQLDEDDLELIKENIGFDIQAVSSEPLPRH